MSSCMWRVRSSKTAMQLLLVNMRNQLIRVTLFICNFFNSNSLSEYGSLQETMMQMYPLQEPSLGSIESGNKPLYPSNNHGDNGGLKLFIDTKIKLVASAGYSEESLLQPLREQGIWHTKTKDKLHSPCINPLSKERDFPTNNSDSTFIINTIQELYTLSYRLLNKPFITYIIIHLNIYTIYYIHYHTLKYTLSIT